MSGAVVGVRDRLTRPTNVADAVERWAWRVGAARTANPRARHIASHPSHRMLRYRMLRYRAHVLGAHVDDAATLVRLARDDAGMTQAELARAAGTTQPVVSAVESGKRTVSATMLERLLRAARMRPSLPLERYADQVIEAARRRGLGNVRAFGSVVRGEDDDASDVDLVVTPERGAGLLAILAFAADAERILGFPVDVLTDSEARATGVDREAVPL